MNKIFKILYKYKGAKQLEPRTAYIEADNILDASDRFIQYQQDVVRKKACIEYVKEIIYKEGMEVIKYSGIKK